MKTLWWMALISVGISGCGELSYKRGASARDLEVAKASCQSAGSEKSIEQCLADQGWVVRQLDDVDLFATASVTADNRPPVATAPAAPATTAGANKPGVAKPGATAADPGPAAPPGASAPPSPPPPPTSPLDLYTVSSWWKMGAGRDVLEADTQDCVKQLGAAHQPDHKTRQVTRGLVVCLHAKGWKALREK